MSRAHPLYPPSWPPLCSEPIISGFQHVAASLLRLALPSLPRRYSSTYTVAQASQGSSFHLKMSLMCPPLQGDFSSTRPSRSRQNIGAFLFLVRTRTLSPQFPSVPSILLGGLFPLAAPQCLCLLSSGSPALTALSPANLFPAWCSHQAGTHQDGAYRAWGWKPQGCLQVDQVV